MTLESETPGALAGASGAEEYCVHASEVSTGSRSRQANRKPNPGLSDRHKSATRMLGYTLRLGAEVEHVKSLGRVWTIRLTRGERVGVLGAAIAACEPGDALAVMQAATADLSGAGMPCAPLFGFMDQAAFWADMADPEELEAFCLASFNAMPRGRQAAFLDYVRGRHAA